MYIYNYIYIYIYIILYTHYIYNYIYILYTYLYIYIHTHICIQFCFSMKQLPNNLNEIQTGYPLRGLVINLLATLWPSLLKARFEWLGRLRNLRCRKLREVFTLFGKQKNIKHHQNRFGRVYVNIRGKATGYRDPFVWGFLKGKPTRNGDSSQQLPRNYLGAIDIWLYDDSARFNQQKRRVYATNHIVVLMRYLFDLICKYITQRLNRDAIPLFVEMLEIDLFPMGHSAEFSRPGEYMISDDIFFKSIKHILFDIENQIPRISFLDTLSIRSMNL